MPLIRGTPSKKGHYRDPEYMEAFLSNFEKRSEILNNPNMYEVSNIKV